MKAKRKAIGWEAREVSRATVTCSGLHLGEKVTPQRALRQDMAYKWH